MVLFLMIMLIVSAVFLIIVILMQQGKGQEMGAVFGGSSQTVFGASGAGSFLTKATVIIAIVFMGSAFLISYLSARRQSPIAIKSYIKKTVTPSTLLVKHGSYKHSSKTLGGQEKTVGKK